MRKVFTKIRRKFCRHKFRYSETIFDIRTHKVLAYGYECQKCGKLFIVPKPGRRGK